MLMDKNMSLKYSDQWPIFFFNTKYPNKFKPHKKNTFNIMKIKFYNYY